MRFALAAFWHETLGFAHTTTGIADFEAFQFTEGEAVIARNRGVRNEAGGFLAAAGQTNVEIVPVLFAAALPSPTISREAWTRIRGKALDGFARAGALDGVFIALHGAALVEGIDDPEAELLAEIRDIVGRGTPVVATLDLHANVSKRLFETATALIAYNTYPHIDIFERGAEAFETLNPIVGGARVTGAFRKLPLLTAPQTQSTEQEPMKAVMLKVKELKADPRVLGISVCPGYPYSDVARLGATIVAYTRDQPQLAERLADDVARLLWSQRWMFRAPAVSVDEAVRIAVASADKPVVLVDSADNIGGGAPGDGTAILAELIRQRAEGAVVTIADAAAVDACFKVRPGDSVELTVGARYDSSHGAPVALSGRIRLLSDGVYHHLGSYMTGLRVEMGRTAVVVTGGIELVLTERKAMPFDAQQLRCLGLEPAGKSILAVKSAVAWRAAYGDIAKKVIHADTPGLCSGDLSRFRYCKRPRPMFPFEEVELSGV